MKTFVHKPMRADAYDPVCSFCLREWTENGDSYNGGCCDEDQATEDDRVAKEIKQEEQV